MSDPVPLKSEDFWVKVVEMLQQNWALIESETTGGVKTYFISDASRVFDEIAFPSLKDAVDALQRNGFRRYNSSLDLQAFLRPPPAPFRRGAHPNGPIYSSGRFWKN